MVFEALAGEIVLKSDVSGAREAERAINDVDDSASRLRKTAGATAGALAAGLTIGLGKATRAAGDFEAAMSESLAIMGDVSESMRSDMAEAAREVATTTQFAANDAAESYFFLASAGLDAAESIEALPEVARFAQAGMFDMARATDLLTDSASALGLEVDEYNSLADTLVKANTLANASVEQFATSLTRQAATSMRNANIAIEEGVAVLAAWADQGIKGERAGNLFRRTIDQLQEAALKNADAFKEFGIQIFDTEGNLRNMADIVEDMEGAFGDLSTKQRAAALDQLGFNVRTREGILALMGNSQALREYQSALSNAGGTAEEVANKQLQNFNAQLGLSIDRVRDVGITIGQAFLGPLTDLLTRLNPAIDRLGAFVNALDESQIVIGSVASVLGLAGVALLAFTTGPITAAIAGIGALSAAVATDFGTIRTTTERVFGVVAEEIRATLQTLDAVTGGALTSMRAQFDALGSDVEGTVTRIVQSVGATLVPAIRSTGETVRSFLVTLGAVWDAHGERVTTAARTGYESARDVILTAVGAVEMAVRPALGRVETAWIDHGGQVETAARTGYQTATDSIRTAVSQIQPTVAPILARVEALWDQHGGAVEGAVQDAYNAIQGHVSTAVTLTRDAVARLTGEIETLWTQHGSAVTQAVTSAYQTVRDEPITVLTFLASTAIPGPLSTIVQAFRDSWAEVEATTRTVFEEIELTVTTSMAAINTQIVSQAADSETAFGTALRQMLTETQETFTVIREVASGLLSAILTVVRENVGGMAEVWRANLSGSNGILANARNAFTELWSGIIKPILDLIQAGWERWGDNILTFFRLTLDTIVTAATIGLDALLTAINVGLDVITGDWQGAWFNIRTFYERTIERVAEWTRTTGMGLVRLAFENVIDAVRSVFTNFRDWLIGNSFIQDTVGAVATWIEIRGRFLVSSAFETVIGAIRSLWEGFKDWIWNTFFPETFQNVKRWIESTGVDAVSEAFGAVVRAIESALNGIDLSGIRNAIQGVINAASDAIDEVTSIPNNVTTTITQEVRTVDADSGDRQRSTRHSTSSGGGGGGGGGGSTHGDRSGIISDDNVVGLQHGGLVRGAGLAMLHPNEAVMGTDAGAQAIAEKMGEILDGGIGGPQLVMREGAIQVDGSTDPEATADAVFRELEREIDRLLGR